MEMRSTSTEADLESINAGASEAEIAENLQKFDRICRNDQKKIANIICKFVADPKEAEDIVQEAFIRVFIKLKEGVNPKYLYGYIVGTAKNIVLDNQRTKKPHMFYAYNVDLRRVIDTNTTADKEGIQNEKLHAAIQALPIGDQELLRWRYGADMTYSEIAAETPGRSINALRARVYQIKNTLKAIMAESKTESLDPPTPLQHAPSA